MSNTLTTTDRERIEAAVRESIRRTKAEHQKWHWDTGKTNCPWGCGDGSGIVGP